MNTVTRRAFTLVELLVVIGIIALLIAILLPTLSSARNAAKQMRALSDVRQLLIGHQLYRLDHEGRVPLAYPPPKLRGEDVTIEYNAQRSAAVGPALPVAADRLRRGRLGPGLQRPRPARPDRRLRDQHRAHLRHQRHLRRRRLRLPPSRLRKHAGESGTRTLRSATGYMVPNTGEHVVFKETQVRRSSELIVFADSQRRGAGPFGGASDGYPNVNAPISNGVNWTVVDGPDGETFEIVNTTTPIAVPLGRYGKGAAVSFFDGHAGSIRPRELLDMRHWANHADTADWNFVDHFIH